jgi:transposase
MQGLAGTAPVPWQSGKYAAARRRTACNKSLRTTLQQFAWHSTVREDWAQTYYRRKRAEGKSHNVAVRALANHWVRLIHAMWRTHTPYDGAIFRAAQQAHARTAA